MAADIISTSFSFHTLDADKNFYVGHGQTGEWKLAGVTLVPSNDVTGSSNKFTLATKQGTTAVCSVFDSEVTALTDGSPQALTMAAAGTALEFGSGDAVKFEYDETGTLALTLQVICAWEKARV
jgi:hypothetical protein